MRIFKKLHRIIELTLMFLGVNYLFLIIESSMYIRQPQQIIFIAIFTSTMFVILLPSLFKK